VGDVLSLLVKVLRFPGPTHEIRDDAFLLWQGTAQESDLVCPEKTTPTLGMIPAILPSRRVLNLVSSRRLASSARRPARLALRPSGNDS
jgi:hypothetical protein